MGEIVKLVQVLIFLVSHFVVDYLVVTHSYRYILISNAYVTRLVMNINFFQISTIEFHTILVHIISLSNMNVTRNKRKFCNTLHLYNTVEESRRTQRFVYYILRSFKRCKH